MIISDPAATGEKENRFAQATVEDVEKACTASYQIPYIL